MGWQDRCGGKLVSLEAAMATIHSGNVVHAAPYSMTPLTLCNGLKRRVVDAGLENVRVDHPASAVSWTEPELAGRILLKDNYATPPNRAACHAGGMEYLPIGVWKSHEIPPGFHPEPDVFLVGVSPPDANGFCSYGSGVWLSPTVSRKARRVIAEVHPEFIRTGGQNFIHVSEIDLLVEAVPQPAGGATPAPPSDEEVAAVEAICTQVAVELVNDGDTLQMGVGTVSASLAPFLDFRNDLGIQTELVTGGIVDLVEKGVVTGARKSIHPYKVVGSACVVLPPDELARMDGNPVFELYDFGYTDDLRMLIQQDNFVAVNNALSVDLTGQVTAEALDHRPYTGVGGQTVFMLAGAYSRGGRSISVLPSSALPTGAKQRYSRIVPTLAPGAPVTVPRTYVDYVVTEFGIAELRGKSLAERARALAEIAHPDFRDELLSEARRLYHA
ncbi:MAG: acetyl-CoA hydrolase/transferase C-terminal domain-containing protein [Pseudomonadales bacterium]